MGGRGHVWGALDHPRVGSRRPWVLVVNRGVVVGDGRAVVVVPRRPGVWAFIGLEVAIDTSTWHAHKPWVPCQRFCGAVCWAPRPSWS